MNDNDLIRRGDALRAVHDVMFGWEGEDIANAVEAINAIEAKQSARIAELEAEVNQCLKQRDDLGSYTVEVYKAIDALLESSEECNFDDVAQKVAPIELWNDLEEALTKNEDKG